MIPLTIGRASEVYGVAARCEIIRHWVDHPLLADVSSSLRALLQSLGDDGDDDYWRNTLGPIRRLSFAFCSVPVPFSQVTEAVGFNLARLNRQVQLARQLFPDSHESLANIVLKLEELSSEASSPLIEPLENLAQQLGSLSVLIRNPRMNRTAAAYFSGNPRLRIAKIVSAMQLRGSRICDVLATIGPCPWFPEYVFSAPRAGAIHVISYRWIRDGWKPGPLFLKRSGTADEKGQNHRIGRLPKIVGDSPANILSQSNMLPDDVLPPMPTFAPNAHVLAATEFSSAEENTPARICYLSGNRAVFVSAGESATSLIIDTSETGRASVRRTPTEELEPGFYLLLRTSGGGDFIAMLADRILGDIACERRSQQVEWKRCLIAKATERFGNLSRRQLSFEVASELRSQQLSQARPANVHYWMSAKCISPRKAEDFVAIMAFAGLETRAKELWRAMSDIDRAHKKAGFLIRRMLLRKITETSLEPLERDGEMIFDLGEQDGGTLSAFQITGISKEEFELPNDRIGVLLDWEE
jgi:hypothetical protein